MTYLRLLLVAVVTMAAWMAVSVTAQTPTSATKPFVGLWVTRWDYRTEKDVQDCLERSAELGATDVFWQVRGAADAFYRSELEPWGRELFRDLPATATDPGFDPLETAVKAAHAHGMKLHAWVNVMPLWKGKQPPRDPRHAFNAHPEWRLRDSTGSPQPLTDHYVIVNPLLPAVQNHIVAVCRDIVTRYPVDGLHMDYVRFVSDSMADPSAYPRDKASTEVFERVIGRPWANTAMDQADMRDLKRDQISAIVRRLKAEAVSARPNVAFTAAVWRRPEIARETYLQDAAKWLAQGTLDRACPMIYTKDDKQFADDWAAWRMAVPDKLLTPGVGIYLHAPGTSAAQFSIAEAGSPLVPSGLALFAYSSLFESVDPNQEKGAAKVKERAKRLEHIRGEVHKRLSAAPSSPISVTPQDDLP